MAHWESACPCEESEGGGRSNHQPRHFKEQLEADATSLRLFTNSSEFEVGRLEKEAV